MEILATHRRVFSRWCGKEHEVKIGIIGAGQRGGTLRRRFSELWHQVSVADSRGQESLTGLVPETGAIAISVYQAARSGDPVIVGIPQRMLSNLPKNLCDSASANVLIVDSGSYYPQQLDGRIDDIEDGMIEKPLGVGPLGPSCGKGVQQHRLRPPRRPTHSDRSPARTRTRISRDAAQPRPLGPSGVSRCGARRVRSQSATGLRAWNKEIGHAR